MKAMLLRLRTSFWVLPTACAIIAGATAVALTQLDEALAERYSGLLFGGGPDSARQILGVIASSVLTFAGLAFSITIVALQLASSQFSPRVLPSMLRDRWTQASLGVFVGTFVFSLLTLRQVRSADDIGAAFVPALAVTMSLLLGLASIAALMGFIHHMAQSIRVVTVIDQIAAEAADSVDRWYADTSRTRTSVPLVPAATGPPRIVSADHDGVLTWYDADELASTAADGDATIELLVSPGTYVIEGQPLLRVTGRELDEKHVRAQLSFGSERDIGMDPAYGFRQLVDIAERALSPGVNDPTTAVQCIDRLHSLLRRIATRDLVAGDRAIDGVLRLRVRGASWSDYVSLSCDEIRHYGATSPRVCRRLDALLRDLRSVVDDDRRDVLDVHLALLHSRRRQALADEEWDAALGPGDPAERPAVDRLSHDAPR